MIWFDLVWVVLLWLVCVGLVCLGLSCFGLSCFGLSCHSMLWGGIGRVNAGEGIGRCAKDVVQRMWCKGRGAKDVVQSGATLANDLSAHNLTLFVVVHNCLLIPKRPGTCKLCVALHICNELHFQLDKREPRLQTLSWHQKSWHWVAQPRISNT